MLFISFCRSEWQVCWKILSILIFLKVSISASLLHDIFAWYAGGLTVFPWSALKLSFCCPLASSISDEESVIYVILPLYVINCFSVAVFEIFFFNSGVQQYDYDLPRDSVFSVIFPLCSLSLGLHLCVLVCIMHFRLLKLCSFFSDFFFFFCIG